MSEALMICAGLGCLWIQSVNFRNHLHSEVVARAIREMELWRHDEDADNRAQPVRVLQ